MTPYIVFLLTILSLSTSQSTDTVTSADTTDDISSIENAETNLSSTTNTTNIPLDAQLCSCFEIELLCSPIETEDEICYYYRMNRISTESYCLHTINYLILGLGNDCNLTDTAANDILTNFAPKTCYAINTDSRGVNINGIRIILNADISDSEDSISSSDSTQRRRQLSEDSLSSSSDSDSFDGITSELDDFLVFSICFDNGIVGSIQENGTIEIGLGDNVFTCDANNMLPDFCLFTTPSTEPSMAPTGTPITYTPSTEPSMAPTGTTPLVCDSTDAINIGFLLDESGSVGIEEWQFLLAFVNRLIAVDLAPESVVALWEFSALHGFEMFLDWTSVSEDRSIFATALLTNHYNDAGQTYTWDAVNRVLDEFWSYRSNCTDGCDTRADMLFVLTDGPPSDQVCPNITARLNQTDIDIILININATETSDWPPEVECLDVRDNGNDIYYIPDFNLEAFLAVEGLIRNKTCSDRWPAGESVRPEPGSQWVYDDGNVGLGPVPTRNPGGGKGGGTDTGRRRRFMSDKSRLFQAYNMYYW